MKNNTKRQRADNISGLLGEREMHVDYLQGYLSVSYTHLDVYKRQIRMCIWKQWKKPRTKVGNLIKMGVPEDLAMQAGNTRRGHWFATHTVAVNMAMTKERLIDSGFYDLATAYQSVHINY